MGKRHLGEQELALLRFVTTQGPLSVSEAAEQYGVEHALARTTILTMMERLRKKGYLTRRKADGSYRYAANQSQGELLRELVGDFTQRMLGGSLQPFVAYLAEDARVTEDELDDLRALVERLESQRKEDRR